MTLRQVFLGNTVRIFAGVILAAVVVAVGSYMWTAPPETFSKKFDRADVPTNYALIKSAMSDTLGPAHPNLEHLGYPAFGLASDQPFYNAIACPRGRAYIPEGPLFSFANQGLLVPLTDLSFETLTWAKALQALNYPKELWYSDIAEFERGELTIVGQETVYNAQSADNRADAFVTKLASKLKTYRDSHSGSTAVLAWQNCNQKPASTALGLNPSGGTLQAIPSYFYALCHTAGLDANNQTLCDGWKSVGGARVPNIPGGYLYEASWNDGTDRCGRLDAPTGSRDGAAALQKSDGVDCHS